MENILEQEQELVESETKLTENQSKTNNKSINYNHAVCVIVVY